MICLIEAKAQGQQKAGDVYVTHSRGISWKEERGSRHASPESTEMSEIRADWISGFVTNVSFRINGHKLLSRILITN